MNLQTESLLMDDEDAEGVKRILLEIQKNSNFNFRNTKTGICINLKLMNDKVKFDYRFWLAKEFGLITSKTVSVGFNFTYWNLTKKGQEFLLNGFQKVDKKGDELEGIKSFLLGIKESKGGRDIVVDILVLNKAFELGLVISNGSSWTLTEFGEEFLVEVGNDTV